MIEEVGKVVRIGGDKASVTVERGLACRDCGLREAERSAPGGKPVLDALNVAGATIGDRVKVRVESVAYTKTLALFFGILILLSIMGAILGGYLAEKFGKSSDIMSALFGTGGLIIGLLVLFLSRKKWARKEYMPVIVEVIRKNAAP